ncbi:MAG: VWA domain-containing protein, partial [Verrucomicrobiota bacterium]
MNVILIALGVALVVGLAEWLQLRRIHPVRYLAFGPSGRPRSWTRWVPLVRSFALGLVAWGLITLLVLSPQVVKVPEVEEKSYRHLVIALDVSPSMMLKDAGPLKDQTRRQRAGDVALSILKRIAIEEVRVSVVAFYTGALPVVIDTFDLDVVKNILDDLPLELAFDVGKSALLDGVREAAGLAETWPSGSATLLVISDGDTIPDSGFPNIPPAVADRLVIGVGDPLAGKFIDGHQSRQDVSTLQQLAHRLRGRYVDANEKQVPSDALSQLAEAGLLRERKSAGQRELALAGISVGAALCAWVREMSDINFSRWVSTAPNPCVNATAPTITFSF